MAMTLEDALHMTRRALAAPSKTLRRSSPNSTAPILPLHAGSWSSRL
jgi:hypothetical protein